MLDLAKRKTVDLLVEQFWKQGYMTVSRRFGTYLPEPSKVGNFMVDIIARQKKNYAIGITITDEDFNDSGLMEKIIYLATRQTKFTGKSVLLYIGVHSRYYKNAKVLIEKIDPQIQRNIRVIQISERTSITRVRSKDRTNVLFS